MCVWHCLIIVPKSLVYIWSKHFTSYICGCFDGDWSCFKFSTLDERLVMTIGNTHLAAELPDYLLLWSRCHKKNSWKMWVNWYSFCLVCGLVLALPDYSLSITSIINISRSCTCPPCQDHWLIPTYSMVFGNSISVMDNLRSCFIQSDNWFKISRKKFGNYMYTVLPITDSVSTGVNNAM